jgi:hypothetical protein
MLIFKCAPKLDVETNREQITARNVKFLRIALTSIVENSCSKQATLDKSILTDGPRSGQVNSMELVRLNRVT